MNTEQNNSIEMLEGQTTIYDFEDMFGIKKRANDKPNDKPNVMRVEDWLRERNRVEKK